MHSQILIQIQSEYKSRSRLLFIGLGAPNTYQYKRLKCSKCSCTL